MATSPEPVKLSPEKLLRNAALEEAALLCDAKFILRSGQGFIREASAARSLAEQIRALKSS